MLKILHTSTVYGRMYRHEMQCDLETLGIAKESWLYAAIEYQAQRSSLVPLPTAEAGALIPALRIASKNTDWISATECPPAKLKVTGVIKAFTALEQALEDEKCRGAARISRDIRRSIKRYAIAINVPRIHRLTALFKTRFPTPQRSGRKLISDFADGKLPIGALAHASYADLKTMTAERIDKTLSVIRSACMGELDAVEKRSQAFESQFVGQSDQEFTLKLLAKVAGRQDTRQLSEDPWLHTADPVKLIASFYALISDTRYWTHSTASKAATGNRLIQGGVGTPNHPLRFCCPRSTELTKILKDRCDSELGGAVMTLQDAMFRLHHGGFTATVASALSIQMHTGWNISTVLELDEDSFEETKDGLVIRSFKCKTGEHTPLVFVDPHHAEAWRSIEFLRLRLRRLKAWGWVDSQCKNIWLRPLGQAQRPQPWISWGTALIRFCKRNALPKFSYEQLRNEALAKVANEKGGIEAARQMAGHASIATTGHYLDQLLLHRRNSSISLRYQQSLQASVKYEFHEIPRLPSVSGNLLYPIGDGSCCISPTAPPSINYLIENICEAKRCHLGEGCVNRRIVIDWNRLEEVVRFSNHFKKNWRNLLESNKERFVAYDLPAWHFNEGLRGVIASGPYRHHLKKVEDAVGPGSTP